MPAIASADRPVRLPGLTPPVPPPPPPPRKAGVWKRRKGNRRVAVQRRAPLVVVADALTWLGRGLFRVGKPIFKLAIVAGTLVGVWFAGRLGVEHVVSSPRFAVHDIIVPETTRVSRDEILRLAAVAPGDRILVLDPKAIAARIATHPWIASAVVHRQLPSTIQIEVALRTARAAVVLGALYLVDERGHPFKRATMEEADGLPILTGIERSAYLAEEAASEAAFREAIALVRTYGEGGARPAISEVAISPRAGFSLFLLEGGAEVKLGRGDFGRKLARFDRILEALKAKRPNALGEVAVIHLDDGGFGRVAIRFSRTGGS